LRAKGHQLYFEPEAKTYHLNISLPWSWVSHAFWGGRLFAAVRARKKKWSPWRRLLYVGGAPLIPFIRLRRTMRNIPRPGRQRELMPRILPVLISGLVAHALGELTGYAFDLGNAERHYSYFEMARFRHVTAEDRKADSE